MHLIALFSVIWVGLVTANSDFDALLEFKNGIEKDPSGQILNSWNPTTVLDSSGCPSNWNGVQCTNGRVISLNLDNIGLVGNTSLASLSKISTLTNLSLANNSFSGPIPSELTKLVNLIYLNLSYNDFAGALPSGLQNLRKLKYLDLRANGFSGKLDEIFAQLQNPVYIDLSSNRFSGSLTSISDNSSIISSLMYLNISSNQLSGEIFGEEPVPLFDSLEKFDASFNRLSGNIPSFNFIVSLKILRLRCNRFTGSIPEAFFQETSLVLTELDLSSNQLTGPVRRVNSTTLKYLNLSSNRLSGSLPITVGTCSVIDLSGNSLTGKISNIRTWGNYAEFIDLSSNQLTGTLPNETTQFLRLTSFKASNNLLTGEIPPLLGTYPELDEIDLSLNQLSGQLPVTLFTSDRLTSLNLSGNGFTGSIPFQNSRESNLTILDLSNNSFSGPLPTTISNLNGLILLNVGKNNFSGEIPREIGMLKNLLYLDLSSNHFNGIIPDNFPDTLIGFNVSYNSLSGTVPANLLKFPDSSFHPGNNLLIVPNLPPLSNPNFSSKGRIHNRQMKRAVMYTLIVCAAAIVIAIPIVVLIHRTISKQKQKGKRDVGKTNSFRDEKCTDTKQPIPTSMNSNQDQSLPVGPALTELETRESPVKFPQLDQPTSSNLPLRVYSPDKLAGDLHLFDSSFVFTSEELSRAPAESIGRSCHGTSYRARLDSGHVLIVKWLKEGIAKSRKEFAREVKKLGGIKHQNLVSLRGFYWGPKEHERIVISDFVDAVSLTTYLCEFEERNLAPLTVQQRLAVSIDISRCLDHLHNNRSIPHGNLKSCNILITPQFQALLTDYSLHRLMTPFGMAEQVLNAGALGYSPPEFASTSKPCPSLKSDVYAFGVVLLELITGKVAAEIVSANSGVVDLIDWVRVLASEDRVFECFDICALEVSGGDESARKVFEEMLKVALRCIRSAAERPEIRTVFEDLSVMRS